MKRNINNIYINNIFILASKHFITFAFFFFFFFWGGEGGVLNVHRSTIFQSCWDGATASWVFTSFYFYLFIYFFFLGGGGRGGLKCHAQGHNTGEPNELSPRSPTLYQLAPPTPPPPPTQLFSYLSIRTIFKGKNRIWLYLFINLCLCCLKETTKAQIILGIISALVHRSILFV